LKRQTYIGLIIPISSICTDRMKPYHHLIKKYTQWHSLYAERPNKLFVGAEVQLVISIIKLTTIPVKCLRHCIHFIKSKKKSCKDFSVNFL